MERVPPNLDIAAFTLDDQNNVTVSLPLAIWSETLAISFHRIIHRSCASPGCHAGAIESCPG
jgi:hypothetical protein